MSSRRSNGSTSPITSAVCSVLTPTADSIAASMNSEADGTGAVPNAASAPVSSIVTSIVASGTMPSACNANWPSSPTYMAVPSLPIDAPSGRTVEATARETPRLSCATRSATGSVADDDAVEKATTSASTIPLKNRVTGRRATKRISPACTTSIWTSDASTTASASQPTWTNTPAPLTATACAMSAKTPNGVTSITNRTICNSTADKPCSRATTGLPASPARMVPVPSSTATNMIASMSPRTSASTILSGTIDSS
ncbi:hypothetical protein WR25_02159 [Diploscapter pachys]|uniref:Uncharacterized protein n=1 Tax=Diploscapter pachys TaxID=2018661 RepID=A0A2A2M2R0_9BILA|nr:hypothetical protein WR25_02159 [Diploscapter pachys]